MFGAIAGDIIGSPYEFTVNNIKTTEFPLFTQKSIFTDDTVMTVAVAVGIMKGFGNIEKTKENIIQAMHLYGHMFPNVGYGQKFYLWLCNKDRKPYNSYGNGSAMRVSPVAWAYNDLATVEDYAKLSAEITHNHSEGIKGACATASAIYMARTGASQTEIKQYITLRYEYNLERSLAEIRPQYTHVESCQESVPQAIIAFLESNNFEDAIRKAVSLGGDSDTIAAITGSIAEAFYGGVPEDIMQQCLLRLDKRLIQAITDFNHWLKRN
ncbi:ADP-ribosylglycohydrolase family protein [Desulfovibrio litoralis]|uniref:ADP-ribosylglycohydrolase n=1 Tax=Desulfovibrio litoralis DSM 11393 TaxID=1121455 RepID=A0A1M7SQ16_9BACT|nr:ADP-ribosylglycohydrolase family protein [Desulfovibrio litoralis]SHN60552.1 ADP-ribosylglycohydrolase [Desulfovibrio litoralis DSM 11393]